MGHVDSGILLDLDGTLTDSAPGILGSYAATLRALGHEPDPALEMNFVIGPPLVDVMPLVLAHYGEDRAELAVATYRRIYGESGWSNSVLYDGILSVNEPAKFMDALQTGIGHGKVMGLGLLSVAPIA